MKLFGAWEVDKTPANCIPRLCTVTINQLMLTKGFLESCSGDSSSLVIAVKMSSSKRTLRSNEISVHGVTVATTPPSAMTSNPFSSSSSTTCPTSSLSSSQINNTNNNSSNVGVELSSISLLNQSSSSTTTCTAHEGSSPGVTSPGKSSFNSNFQQQSESQHQQPNQAQQVINLDLTFALQYPHFLKKNGNQLQILLQRRKRYKNRAILGYKTLAGGVINMAEVLQKSHHMKKELDLRENIKDSLSSSTRVLKSEIVAKIIMSSLKSQPVDHESNIGSNNTRGRIFNSVNPSTNGSRLKTSMNESADVESDDEVLDEFSPDSGSESDPDNNATGRGVGRTTTTRGSSSRSKWMNVRRRHSKKSHHHNPSASMEVDADGNPSRSVHNRNLKQKFIALLKKFKIPDSEASDSEEQAALENELIANASCDIGQLGNIEDIFEFEDSDVDSVQDFDDFSMSSTPRPGLKPFFSSKTTLVEEV